MNKKIFHGLKVTLAAIVATLIAFSLNLTTPISAGIVAILSTAPTKTETIKTAINRLSAFVVALSISFVCFKIGGFTPTAFFIYILIYTLICQIKGWQSAIAMNSVLVSHFLVFKTMNLSAVINEVLIFFIGVSCGIIINLHLRKDSYCGEKVQIECDNQIKIIIKRLSQKLIGEELDENDEDYFNTLKEIMKRGKKLARENYLNDFFSDSNEELEYLIMREKQTYILKNIYKKIYQIHSVQPSTKPLSLFLKMLSQNLYKDNDTMAQQKELHKMYRRLRILPPPSNRSDFEDRAMLFAILRDIEEFLLIKNEYILNKDDSEE